MSGIWPDSAREDRPGTHPCDATSFQRFLMKDLHRGDPSISNPTLSSDISELQQELVAIIGDLRDTCLKISGALFLLLLLLYVGFSIYKASHI